MKKINKAFTLVELIISIAILAILGTIAFISIQSYSRSARDSVRITDLSNIKTSLELFHIETGKFPLTTDGYNVTYGGGNVWEQGIFGEATFQNVSRLDKIPLDPLTEKEYTYSLLNTKQEYELAGIMEGESLVLNNVLGNKVNAAEQIMSVMVTGNYNGEMLNVTKSGTLCVVAVPSIITSSGTTLESIVPNNYFVYNNYTNLPSNYNTNTRFKLLGETDLKLVNELNIDLYCGDFSILNTNESVRLDFIENFQKAYTGTQVEVSGRIMEVLELTIDKTNPTPDLKIYTIDLIENVFKTTISDEQKLLAAECNTDYHFEGSICISNTKTVTITNGEGIQTWNGSSWGSTVLSNCNPTFHTEDNITCINNIQGCTITNGTGTDTWNGSSWDCAVTTCDIDYYNSGNNTCTSVGTGYYSNSTDTTRTACTNNPDTTSRDYTYTTNGNGTNNCTATYTDLCGVDLYETANGTCTTVGTGNYSAANSNTSTACTNKPTNSVYSGAGNGTNNCTYTCDTNYSGTSCTADTKSTTCGGSIVSNATSSTISTYTQTWDGSTWTPTTNWGESQATCDFNCNANYTWNGSSCIADTRTTTCGGSIVSNATASTATTYTQIWNGSIWTPTTSWGEFQSTCDFNCNSNFTWNGSSCVANTQTCTVTGGGGTQVWNGTAWGACTVDWCTTDYYKTATSTCTAVGNGYYSNSTSITRTACTNNPSTASRNYTYTSDGNGTNSCTATYTDLCGLDLYETVNGTCVAVGIGNYSAVASNTSTACTNKPTNSIYSGDGNGTNNCTYTCNTNYSGTSCTADTQTFTCTTKPANSSWNTVGSYPQTWSGTAWLPVNSTTAHNITASTTICRYICNAGSYYNGTTCILASAGYYVSAAGSSSQTACPAGQYQASTGQTSCVSAGAGYYVGTIAQTAQTACGGETKYQGSAGQSSCNTVTSGYYTTGGTATTRTGQTAASAGYYAASGVQTACSAGQYQASTGQTSCVSASAGYYVGTTAQIAQIECGGNTKYQGSTGQSSCNTVTAGYYTTGGTATTRTGQTAAPTAYYATGGVQTACTNKPTYSTYSASSALASNSCPYTCNSGYSGTSCTPTSNCSWVVNTTIRYTNKYCTTIENNRPTCTLAISNSYRGVETFEGRHCLATATTYKLGSNWDSTEKCVCN